VRDASGLYVLDANRMWVRVCQRKRELLQPAEVAPAGRQFYARLGLSWRSVKLLVIEIDGELSLASAGITQGDAKLKIICVCDGSRNGAGPSHREALFFRMRRVTRHGIREGPIKVDLLVDPRHLRRAIKTWIRKILARQAIHVGVSRGAQHGAGHRYSAAHRVRRALRIDHVVRTELLDDAIYRQNRL